ncbi:DUF2897 family protein [Agarivorans sp. B2Z047]|nr:DUF2897 family protein [Agarivorans sp. B2Z047]MPW27697.1 DUF2897 family protein [Agarivorans sp. B2Z047]
MAIGYVILIIALVLGFILGNLMLLRHMDRFNIKTKLPKSKKSHDSEQR